MTEPLNNCDTREVRLSGALGRKFGRVHILAVETPAEAIRALCVLLPGFRDHMEQTKQRFRFLVGDVAMTQPEKEAELIRGHEQPFTLAPFVEGSKSALGTILTGAAILALGVATGGAGLGLTAAYAAGGLTAAFGSIAGTIGMSLILGGVSQLLAPTPKTDGAGDRPENKASQYFNGPVNTIAQGNAVPVCYGRLIVGSAVISAGVSVGDIAR